MISKDEQRQMIEKDLSNYDDMNNCFYWEDLDEDVLREYHTVYDDYENIWDIISNYQTLSENFMREFADKLNWEALSAHQEMSKEFILEFKDKVDWNCICKYKSVDIDIIEVGKEKIDWSKLSIYQELSEEILNKYFKQWHFTSLLQHQRNIPDSFFEKHWNYFANKPGYVKDILTFQKNLSPEMKRKLLRKEKEHLDKFIKGTL